MELKVCFEIGVEKPVEERSIFVQTPVYPEFLQLFREYTDICAHSRFKPLTGIRSDASLGH